MSTRILLLRVDDASPAARAGVWHVACGPATLTVVSEQPLLLSGLRLVAQQPGRCEYLAQPGFDASLLATAGQSLQLNYSQPTQTLHSHPQRWSLHYDDPLVRCDYCQAEFKSSELLSNDDQDFWSERVCPVCGTWDCCETSRESVQEFFQRTNDPRATP